MAQIEIFGGDCGLVADDEMDDGWIRIGAYETWYMTMDTYLTLQDLEVMEEVALFLDAFGPGLWQLPPEYRP